jgi:hypothetical protein
MPSQRALGGHYIALQASYCFRCELVLTGMLILIRSLIDGAGVVGFTPADHHHLPVHQHRAGKAEASRKNCSEFGSIFLQPDL